MKETNSRRSSIHTLKATNTLGDETRPSVMLLVANSYRQLGKQLKALELYNQLIHIYSNTSPKLTMRAISDWFLSTPSKIRLWFPRSILT